MNSMGANIQGRLTHVPKTVPDAREVGSIRSFAHREQLVTVPMLYFTKHLNAFFINFSSG